MIFHFLGASIFVYPYVIDIEENEFIEAAIKSKNQGQITVSTNISVNCDLPGLYMPISRPLDV